MSQVILIAGNAERFLEDMRTLRLKLAGIAKVLRLIPTSYVNEDILAYRLERAIAKKTREPLLIVYSGHGSKRGWALDDARILTYKSLAKMLAVGKRPVTILNDTCYAMRLADALAKSGVAPERVSLIAACGKNETTTGGLGADIVGWWKTRASYRAGTRFYGIFRWGANSDDHFDPSYDVQQDTR